MSQSRARRDVLDSSTDSVEVLQSTAANLETNANLRVGAGDVGPGNPVPVEPGTDAVFSVVVDDSVPIAVSDAGASLTVDDGGASLTVDDGGGALTVDGTVSISGTVAVEQATSVVVEDGGSSLSVDDGGGSLTVDGTVSVGAGFSVFESLDLDETEEQVKGTAGTVHGWWLYNAAATALFVKFYNATAANVTVGTTTPLFTLAVPAGAAANVELLRGLAFSTAITIACTTGRAHNDTGEPAANDLLAIIFYE